MAPPKTTIRDLSQATGVSISTISRILNNKDKARTIPEEIQERVKKYATELNYTPNINARRVFAHRAGIIGLLVPSYTNMFMHIFEDGHLTRLISGIEEGLAGSNNRLLLIFNDNRFKEQREYMSLIQSQSIDGLLVWGAQPEETFWREPVEAGLPIVFTVTAPGRVTDFNYIGNATRQGTLDVLNELIRRGHRNILFIRNPKQRFVPAAIIAAVQQFQAEHPEIRIDTLVRDIDKRGDLPYDDFRTPGGYTALLAYNHKTAFDIWEALKQHGINVPQEIEIIALYSYPKREKGISTLEVNDFEIGRLATQNLLNLIDHPEEKFQIEITPNFFFGKTTRN